MVEEGDNSFSPQLSTIKMEEKCHGSSSVPLYHNTAPQLTMPKSQWSAIVQKPFSQCVAEASVELLAARTSGTASRLRGKNQKARPKKESKCPLIF